ncbi:sulfite exporter TauE/SafE protein [Toxoplasma gondii VAND]|uniref:Sulfite exporter TauE/SafE protein n=1 Tax=Toxoplasma gondii VAND TaxID=933077 RepID=A0A086QA37_TOXGO|nr:sulfite exporter TauE/SafE protein [Toxoplasma gondii VAND]
MGTLKILRWPPAAWTLPCCMCLAVFTGAAFRQNRLQAVAFAAPVSGELPFSPAAQTPAATDTGVLQSENAARDKFSASGFFSAGNRDFNQASSAPVPPPQTRPSRANLSQERLSETPKAVVFQTPPPESAVASAASSISAVNLAGPAVPPTLIENTANSDVALPRTQTAVAAPAQKYAETPVDVHRSSPVSFNDTQLSTVQPGNLGGTAALSAPDVARKNPEQFPSHLVQSNADQNGISGASTLAPAGGNGVATLQSPRTPEAPVSPAQARNTEAASVTLNPATVPGEERRGNSGGSDEKGDMASSRSPDTQGTRSDFLPSSGSIASAAESVSGPELEAREHTTDDALEESRKKLEALRNAAKAVEAVRAPVEQPPFDAHEPGSADRYRAFDRTVPGGQETLPFERVVTAPTSTAAEDLTQSRESRDIPSVPQARTDSRSPSQQQPGGPGPHGRGASETGGVELRDKPSFSQTSSDVPNSSVRRDSPSHVSPRATSLSPVPLPSDDPRAGAPEAGGGTRVSSEELEGKRADQETLRIEGRGDEVESPSEAKKAPPVLPTASFFSICCLLAGLFVFACLASAGGIGGGSVFVALLVGLGHMQLAYAVPISKVMVFAASFCSFVLHRKLERQTAENARAVAQDWVDLLVPLALSGSLVGVVLNTILPGFYLLLLLSCLLFGLSARTMLSAMHLYKKEVSLAVQQPFEEIFLPSPTTSPRRSSSSGSASPFHASCTAYRPDSQLSTDGSRLSFAVAATHCAGPPSPSFFPEEGQDRASEENASPSRLSRPPGSLPSEALLVPCCGEAETHSPFIRSNGDEKDQEPFAAARSEKTPVGLQRPREGRNPFSDEEAAEPFLEQAGESRSFERMHPEWVFPPGGNSNPVEEEDATALLHGGEDGRQAGKGGAASGAEGFEPLRLDRRLWKEEAWRQTSGESEIDTEVGETGSRRGKHGKGDREDAEPKSEEGIKEEEENGARSGKRNSRDARAGTTVDVESVVSSPEALDASTRNGLASGVDSVPSAAPIPPSSSSPAYPAFPRFYSLEDEEDLTHISFMQAETSEERGSLPASVLSALNPALDSEFLAGLPDRNAARGPLSKALNLLRSACEGMVSSAQDGGASSFSSGQTPIDPTLLLPSASALCPGTNLEASNPRPVSPRFASTEHLASYQRLSGEAKRPEEGAPGDLRGLTEGQGVARRETLIVDTSARLLQVGVSSEASLEADRACHGGLVAWLRALPGFAKARKAVGQVERLCFQGDVESPHYFVLLLLLLVHVFASSLLHLLLKHGAGRAAAVVAALALLLGVSVQLRLSVLIFRKHFPAGTAPPAPTLREVLSAVSASVAALWRHLKKVGRAAGRAAFAVGELGKNALHRSGLFAAAPASVAFLEHDSGRDSIEVAELSVRGRFRNAGENPFLCAVGDIQEIRLSEETGQEHLSHLSLDLTGVRQSGDDHRGHFSKKTSGARLFDDARNRDCPSGVDDAVRLSWTSLCFEGYIVSPVAALPPLLLTPFIGFLTGVFAGLVGIGGGVVFSPFLLLMGNDPVSAVATASACVVFTSSSTSLQFLLIGRLPILYASLFGLVAAAAAACATCGIHRLRRAVGGRMSVIAGCVASAVTVASALTVWRCIEVGIYGE